ETGMMFLALWYTLGIVMVGMIGTGLGRFLLRW
ncbi:NrsF family protein, partial [Devosia sp.]